MAKQARRNGLEGRARVCARRAAGIAVREFLSRQGTRLPTVSSIDLLASFQQQPGTPADVRAILAHLLERVDADHHLPPEIDLISETYRLAARLGFQLSGDEDA